MMHADPIGLPGIAAFLLGALAFAVAVIAARWRRAGGEEGATHDRASRRGVQVQGAAYVVSSFGAQRVLLDPLGAPALIEAGTVAALMAGAVALFVWATRAMGDNWSIVARTRTDHQLVQTGPFRHLRHPIYTAMALVLIADALALGHARQLLLAIPVFGLGTWLRVRSEEALLRRQFGPAYAAYAARVKRFVPGLF